MNSAPTVHSRSGRTYRVLIRGEQGFHSSAQFEDPASIKQFIRQIDVPLSFWQQILRKLGSELGDTDRRMSAWEDEICRLAQEGKLRLAQVGQTRKPKPLVAKGPNSTRIFFVDRENATDFQRLRAKKLNTLESAKRFVATLNLPDKTLSTLIERVGASNAKQPNDVLLQQIADGKLLLVQENVVLPKVKMESVPATGSEAGNRKAGLGPQTSSEDVAKTFFEINLLDDVGEPIDGIEIVLLVDGEEHKLTTSGGKAELKEVPSKFAIAQISDLDSLFDKVFERWGAAREGEQPAEDSQTVESHESIGRAVSLSGGSPHTLVLAPPQGQISTTLFDKSMSSPHANVAYIIDGPVSLSGETDENGSFTHAGVPPGNYTLSFNLEFFKDTDDHIVDEYKTSLVVLGDGEDAHQDRAIGVVPKVEKASIQGMLFDTNKSFLLPSAIKSMSKIREIYSRNNPSELIIVGHTDTTGEPDINDPLSEQRAESTKAFLEDNVDEWLAMYDEGVNKAHRWGSREDRLMIVAMPDFLTRAPEQELVEWFQASRNLKVDNIAGPQTRTQLITEYMSLDGASLATQEDFQIEVSTLGLGENFPLVENTDEIDSDAEDGLEDPLDRRVEFFFFDKEFGVIPSLEGDTNKAYESWRERAAANENFVVDGTSNRVEFIECEDALFQTNSAVPLPEVASEDKPFSAIANVAVALRFAFEQPANRALVAGHTDTTASPAVNDPLSEERALAIRALLEGDRDLFRQTCHERNIYADKEHILKWADEAFGFGSTVTSAGLWTAVRNFQAAYNASDATTLPDFSPLDVDGDFGPLTWGAVFDLYELRLMAFLHADVELLSAYRKELRFVDKEKPSMGFGEHHPIEAKGQDNFRSQANRRVEILFFGPGEEPDLTAPPDVNEVYLPGLYKHIPLPVEVEAIPELQVHALTLPSQFSNGRTFPKPSALEALNIAAARAQTLNGRIVIVGHTDYTFNDADNEALALARAEAVKALLTKDVNYFINHFENPNPLKVWDWEEVQWMLQAVKTINGRCYVANVDDVAGEITRMALGNFQLFSRELGVDYSCNPETLEKLIQAYLDLIEGPAFTPEQIEVVVGGSWHPPRPFGQPAVPPPQSDDFGSSNRRVDVFVFAQPVQPSTGNINPSVHEETAEYRSWCLRAQPEDLSEINRTMPIRVFDSDLKLLRNVSLTLKQVDAESGEFTEVFSIQTDAEGTAEFEGPDSSYHVQLTVEGIEHDFSIFIHKDEFGGHALRLPHFISDEV